MKKITLLVVFLLSIAGFSQRTCRSEALQERLMTDPDYKRQYLEQQAQFEVEYKRLLQIEAQDILLGRISPSATKVVPVAIHFPSVSNTSSASIKTCLRNLAQTQVNVINADFNAANTDISNWTTASSFYPGVTVGNLDVQFVLATRNHPAGTGITNGTVAVTFGTDYLTGDQFTDATWAGYLNFVVTQLGETELGVSYTPASPALGHALKVNTFCFGKGGGCTGYVPSAPFNLGRTVTHELGHYYNLLHTFGNCGTTATCATTGDRVCDTPAVSLDSNGCPATGSLVGCIATQKVLTMNYMDYTNDSCMYMFTNGQKTRALAQLNTVFSNYVTNALNTEDYNTVAFSISPNPSNGIVNIQFQNLISDFSVEVYDLMGREVSFGKINNLNEKSISLDNVAKGIYYVTVSTDNTQTTRKVIIE